MDCTFLILIFFLLVIFIFIAIRICVKATVWSSLVGAFVYSLLIILLIQAVIPSSWFDNRYSIQGVLIIIWITVILAIIYITDRIWRDTDLYAVSITDRNVILN